MKRPLRIGVVGERDAHDDNRSLAHAVGEALAKRGVVVVCGAMGGVMEAAARGAVEAGGIVVGIVPTASERDASSYVTIPVVTGMGEARNAIIARTGEAMIAIGGSYGTLSEIALALRFGVPVVGLATWRIDAPAHGADPILRVSTAAEAVERACALAQERRTRADA